MTLDFVFVCEFFQTWFRTIFAFSFPWKFISKLWTAGLRMVQRHWGVCGEDHETFLLFIVTHESQLPVCPIFLHFPVEGYFKV